MMRLLTILAIMAFSSPAYAEPCQGFLNAMDALEAELKMTENQAAESRSSSASHTKSLNQTLDELENAVQDNRAEQARQSNTSSTHVTPRNML